MKLIDFFHPGWLPSHCMMVDMSKFSKFGLYVMQLILLKQYIGRDDLAFVLNL